MYGRGSLWSGISSCSQGNKNVGGYQESTKIESEVYVGTIYQLDQNSNVPLASQCCQTLWFFRGCPTFLHYHGVYGRRQSLLPHKKAEKTNRG